MHGDATVPLSGSPEATLAPKFMRSRRLSALRALWYGRSVRARLLVVFVLIDVFAALIAGGVTILKARTATRIEIAASMQLAELLVTEAINALREAAAPQPLLTSLPLQLRFLRHVRIIVTDVSGASIADTGPGKAWREPDQRGAPTWFQALIAPPLERHELPVVVAGTRIGSVWLLGAPSDEVAEVWGNTVALGAVAAVVNLAVVGILYLLFGRVLVPLTGVARGLLDLERRNYQVRLPRPHARELAGITDRFNALAAALEAARADNAKLTHRLITAQDDERRRTARELHDEVGPCLFGLKANATSLATAIGEATDSNGRSLAERVGEIVGIVARLQLINRSLLNRLRPMALGHVPLRDLLAEVVRDRAQQQPQIVFTFSATNVKNSYGDSIDLTIYRCVQESLTNAIRHAAAKNIAVALQERSDGTARPSAWSRLELTVRDDGRGIASGTPKGFGLVGMQERVQALGGDFALITGAGGSCIEVVMPLDQQSSNPATGPLDART